MKKFSKILSVALLVALVLSFGAMAYADETTTTPANGSITITPPTGLPTNASNEYKIYKVFDATVSSDGSGISYTLCNGALSEDMKDAGFSVDGQGNVSGPSSLNQDAKDAIAEYAASNLVATVQATGSDPVTAAGLGAGYYYITTTTGSLVTIDSTKPSAEVIDKNTVPSVDKKITGASSVDDNGKKALAQVGTDVNYEATIVVGSGAKGYVFHDTMEAGLTYNKDVTVSTRVNDGTEASMTTSGEPEIVDTVVANSNYSVVEGQNSETFTVTFNDAYMKTLPAGTVLVVKYSAKVNEDAITMDPLNNTCYVSYGDENSNNRTPDSEAEVYEAKFTVVKNQPAKEGDEGAVLNEADGKYYKPLAGAGFVIKNADGKYYKLTETEGKVVVSWVDAIADATEYKSDADGNVPAFTGLANGTYTLVESTVPSGFNKVADQTFTIKEHDYTAKNLEQEANVINNKGTELPSTGGIGTTIFYVVGGVLVLAAIILLVTKKRMSE